MGKENKKKAAIVLWKGFLLVLAHIPSELFYAALPYLVSKNFLTNLFGRVLISEKGKEAQIKCLNYIKEWNKYNSLDNSKEQKENKVIFSNVLFWNSSSKGIKSKEMNNFSFMHSLQKTFP